VLWSVHILQGDPRINDEDEIRDTTPEAGSVGEQCTNPNERY
jgi:hypothetical protein